MMTKNYPELTANAKTILSVRYLTKDEAGDPTETPDELFHRVADTVGGQSGMAAKYFDLMRSMKFLPNSPTLVNAGKDDAGCLSACFVVSPKDSLASIMEVASDAAMIEKYGGGIGFGLSDLRPKGDAIKTTHGMACGPVAVMKIYSTVGAQLTQGAFRMGAHMGQLHVSHPDIREFITCKDNDDTLTNFNISVQVSDEFMDAVYSGGDWDLINPHSGEVTETVKAVDLWNEITESAWKTGDPGIVFMSRVHEASPNPQMGPIKTSNPCGEEFLENYGNCCLGSIDLNRIVVDGVIDRVELERVVRTAVRFLDDVIEVNVFPLQKLREVNLATRRIGLGVMGWADALSTMGIPYDSPEAVALAEQTSVFIRDTAWDESARLAEERGPFTEYQNSAVRLWREARGLPPVRHSSVTTIAPTGTISRLAGCSSGIEPHFDLAWESQVLWASDTKPTHKLADAPTPLLKALTEQLGNEDKARAVLQEQYDSPVPAGQFLRRHGLDPAAYHTAMQMDPPAHVSMQAAWQKGVTNSVSKTINMRNESAVEDVRDAYRLAYEAGCKAVTVYRDGSKSQQVLEAAGSSKKPEVEPLAVVQHPTPRPRPPILNGKTELTRTGHGNMYVTVNADPESGVPFEVFVTLGKAGSCDSANLEAISRLVSLALRTGVSVEDINSQLRGISCCPAWTSSGTQILSAPDAVGAVLAGYEGTKVFTNGSQPDSADAQVVALQRELIPRVAGASDDDAPLGGYGKSCPECNSKSLMPAEGCLTCLSCGYSKC